MARKKRNPAPDASPETAPDAAAPATPDTAVPAPETDDNDATRTAQNLSDDSLRELMASNFIEYASYVIKDRAIPDIDDGLKPVQRRILHALWELDDGRFHKVANVVGHSMRYHPHGDASIYSALVVLANKEYFIDRQGNFGNIYTGDEASAARYIECRLSPLAREVLFNPETTQYTDSYDGRNREPVTLPAKVPALLMLGADGIAVGMTTRIFPHNFCELLRAQIAILRDEPFQVHPDFQTGGTMDVAEYADGAGRIRVRARMEAPNDKTIVIRDIPATTNTEGLIASIEDAARRGKIKIASINDYTAEKVEIEINLPRGVYADETIRLLYGYTDCEVSLTSNLVVIRENRPVILTVSEILRYNTEKLLRDLKRELELEFGKLQERFHEKTLAQIFIENRIYKRIEKCETYELVLAEVHAGLERFRDQFRREVTDADIEKLLQLAIRRISLFDINKNRQELDDILKGMETVQDNLRHLKRYAIRYLDALLKKYGPLFPRRTQIADLDEVNVREVALRNLRVGHDRLNHFVGSAVRNSNKDEEPLQCSEFDRLVLLRNDGEYKVVPVQDKLYAGPVRHVLLADRNQVYSMIYRDRKSGVYYAKRFRIESYIMDKDYTALPPGCIIEQLYTNYGVQVRCEFAPRKRLREPFIDLSFDDIEIRSAGARGFKLATYEIERFTQLKRGSASPQGNGDTPPAAPAAGEATPDAVAEAGVVSPAPSTAPAAKAAEAPAPPATPVPAGAPAKSAPAPRIRAKADPPAAAPARRPARGTGGSAPTPSAAAPAPLPGTKAPQVAPPPEPPVPAPHSHAETKRGHGRTQPPPDAPAAPSVPPQDHPRSKAPSRPASEPDKTPVAVPPAKGGRPARPAAAVPSAPAAPSREPVRRNPAATSAAKPPPEPASTPGKKPLRKLIDEDSPFFLE